MTRSRARKRLLPRLVAFVVLMVIAYLAAVTIPVVVATFRFSQAMDAEVLHGDANEAASSVHGRLVAAAHRLGLDVSHDQIVVKKNGAQYEIDADYVVPLQFFGGFTIDWHFRPHKEGTRRPPAFRD
jgi:hypothetical protein